LNDDDVESRDVAVQSAMETISLETEVKTRADVESPPEPDVPRPGSPARKNRVFGAFSRRFSKEKKDIATGPLEVLPPPPLPPPPSNPLFSFGKGAYVDVKDKNGLLIESRALVAREKDVVEVIVGVVAKEEFDAFKTVPYSLFDRAIRTELQNKPPGKTWTVSIAKDYARLAIERMHTVMKWRDDNAILDLLTSGLLPEHETMHANWPVFVHGRDSYGHPITSERVMDVNAEGLKSRMTPSEIMRHRIQMMEAMEYYKARAAPGIAHKVYKHIWIFDLEGLTISSMTAEKKNFMLELVRTLTHKYSDSLYSLYIVNTPVVFRVVWTLLQPILQPATKSKICIFGPSDAKKLHKQLMKHEIPLSAAPRCCGGSNDGRRMDAFIADTLESHAADSRKQ